MIQNLLNNIANDLTVANTFHTATEPELNILLERVEQANMPVVAFVPPVTVSGSKKQGNLILADYSINMLFLRAITESSLDGATDVNIYPVCIAMRTLAIEFMNRLQKTEPYKKGMNTTIDYNIMDILEKFDSYLAGVRLSFTARLWIDYDYCKEILNGIVLIENGDASILLE